MNSMTGIIKMHSRDKWLWLITPWIILLFSFFVNIVIAFFLDKPKPIYTGGLVSIFIYMMITGIIILMQTFPFALGLSIRRTDYFFGTSLMAILISVAFALVLFLLSIIESKLTGGWGLQMHYFHLPYLNDGTAVEQLLVYFMLMIHMFYLGFILSSIFRRFGRSGLFVFAAVMFIISSVCVLLLTYNQWWGNLFTWFAGHTAFELALWSMPLTALYVIVSYLLLRKSTI